MQNEFQFNNSLSGLQETLTSFYGNENHVDHGNLDVLFDGFLRTIKNTVIDLHAPVRYLRKQRCLRQKSRITKTIFKSVKHKHTLYSSHFINGNDDSKQCYKNTAICLPELKNTRSSYITKMHSTMSNIPHVDRGND